MLFRLVIRGVRLNLQLSRVRSVWSLKVMPCALAKEVIRVTKLGV